ncbi:hypothetical protein EYF80_039487 [Liparis tanakae]|uniref:Uncharacterized protein n=1 Tax=Liparis tanakae TaxID=230148 RepID=A0A4Z2GAS4_9TELE|nr:hypothetical protein EYF80_039487 [Liparis tanakae]
MDRPRRVAEVVSGCVTDFFQHGPGTRNHDGAVLLARQSDRNCFATQPRAKRLRRHSGRMPRLLQEDEYRDESLFSSVLVDLTERSYLPLPGRGYQLWPASGRKDLRPHTDWKKEGKPTY